jgi:uncharacterized protein YyaL (SSP411 family)
MPEPDLPTLAESASPFLRHGATQPVNWLPWSEGAFERARRESRPVLLDIGAVWCHWCHVMDQESYEDPETARLINELFVPIKVDRDERPDVDARYQRAVQALTGQGGWPLTAFLTPDGDVFYAGTYFPPEDRFGRPSLRRVLAEVARVWREERERALEAVHSLRTHLSALEQTESDAGELSPSLVEHGVEAFADVYDFRHGGFGRAPKFPNAGAILLLLDRAFDTGEGWIRRMVGETLTAMGRGGVYDHLGGGFHRYSVDARWIIPHFEKMAYDNGPLLAAYARAAAALGDPFLRRVAEGVVGYYRDVSPALAAMGGFPASQDADVGAGDDGGYWTWTEGEVGEALGGDARLVEAAVHRYGLTDPASGMHTAHDRHVLYLAEDVPAVAARLGVEEPAAEQLLVEVAARLKEARDLRPRPFVDETVYSGWAALVASGHLAAARHLGLHEAGEAALRAIDRIWGTAFDVEDGVAHRVGDGSAGGYLEDQAHVAEALLDAYEWTQRPEYLERARQLVDVMVRRYLDPESGAFTDRPRGEPAPVRALAEAHLPIVDSPAPSGNGVAALVLLRLDALLHEGTYRERALAVLAAFASTAQQMPTAVATYLRAVDWATSPVTTVVVVGEDGDEAAESLLGAALTIYRPRTVVRRFAPAAVSAEALPPPLRAMVSGEAPRAYLCAGQSCAAPVSRVDELVDLMRTFKG